VIRQRGFTLIEFLVVIAIILVLLFLLFPGGQGWLVELPLTLVLGWIPYLARVIPKLNPDPWTVGTAVGCLAGVTVGSHYFLRWLAGRAVHWPWERTLRCVGLIVLMFVAGIAVVGMIHQTSWLVRSPEQLVEDRGGRRAAPRMHSANNLKQIGLAGFYHHDSAHEFPRSSFDDAGRPMHSWQTALLPYIEEGNLYNQIDRTKPWTHPDNSPPLSTPIKVYHNPSVAVLHVNGLGASHYAGNGAVVLGDAKKTGSFPAGTSNTILAGEVSSNFRAWGDPLNARDPRLGASGHPNGFGSPTGKPTQFVMLDGSVRTFDPQELTDLLGK
jgi:prepilin-type N-terminal cleavage/methylation domain-containing protein